MMGQVLLLLAVFIPVVGSLLLPFAAKCSPRLRNGLALFFVAASLAASVSLLPTVLQGTPVQISIALPLGLSFGFLADGLAVFMAIISSFVGAIIVFYSWGYMHEYKNLNEYYLMVVLFIGAMMGLVYSTNLIFLYLFWEICAIACWRLIGFFRESDYIKKANKAFMITVFGAIVMLLGFFLLYQQTGTFDMTQMKAMENVPELAIGLILVGIFAKYATLPFHTWLPDAGIAPSPVTSLLHAAVLVKIGVYAFARLFLVNIFTGETWTSSGWSTTVLIITAVSALVSGGAAIIEKDIKRIIAYSTVSQLAFIFLGLASGNIIGIAGGLLYILMHSLAKGGLFLCAGIVEHNTHTKDITKMGGLIKTMPVTGVAFLLCSFSVMGIPPFGGFFSKFMVINGAVEAGQFWIALTFIIGAILTIIYLLRVFTMVFLGTQKTEGGKEGSLSMVSSVGILAVLSLAAGILINFPSDFVQQIVQQMAVIIK